jgi:hypothetical protein
LGLLKHEKKGKYMSWGSEVQVVSGGGTSVNSAQSSAFGSAVTTDNSILVHVMANLGTAATITISDTEGNTYVPIGCASYNAGSPNSIANPTTTNVPAGVTAVGLFLASGVTGGSSFKVTATLGGSAVGNLEFLSYEISGVVISSPQDGSAAVNAGASGSPSTTFSTTYPSDLVVTAICGLNGSGAGVTFSAPSGYSGPPGNGTASSNCGGTSALQFFGAAQTSVTATWTTSGSTFTDWVTVSAALKADLIVQSTAQAQGTSSNSLQTGAFGSPVTSGNTILLVSVGRVCSTDATITSRE